MSTYAIGALLLVGAALFGSAHAETVKPVTMSNTDLAGALLARANASGKSEGNDSGTDVTTFTSTDTAFQTGIYRSGPSHEEIKGPGGLPYNEFLYFLSGSVKLTSADGSVMTVKAGEAVTLPKGWTGHFDTSGYTKLYAVYSPHDGNEAACAVNR
ncbi:cupin domain-containing protein [Burkholderia territorii]|uniref:cupin domain-containing protein n=1 Tax=Burkholderia territorii TaxID=1503055 RepID=UPI000751E2A3|nr:cupin domain-containing protein [Burkholderia territorii]KVG53737.1 cupin [Burkholderia territorii]